MNLDTILQDREDTHGAYADVAKLTQALQDTFYNTVDVPPELSPEMKLGIFMILHKLARVFCGNPKEVDHWLDIAGYATLVINSLSNDKHEKVEEIIKHVPPDTSKFITPDIMKSMDQAISTLLQDKEARKKFFEMFSSKVIKNVLETPNHPLHKVAILAKKEGLFDETAS